MTEQEYGTEYVEREAFEQLQTELNAANARVDALSKQNRAIIDLLIGEDREITEDGVKDHDPVYERLMAAEEELSELNDEVSIVHTDGGGTDSPDNRAKRLRHVLIKNAKKNGGKSKLTRDSANSALGGGYHRGSVIEAMKRAADGGDRDDVNGATDLESVGGIDFTAGQVRGEQSKLVAELHRMTEIEERHNLTTGSEGMGG